MLIRLMKATLTLTPTTVTNQQIHIQSGLLCHTNHDVPPWYVLIMYNLCRIPCAESLLIGGGDLDICMRVVVPQIYLLGIKYTHPPPNVWESFTQRLSLVSACVCKDGGRGWTGGRPGERLVIYVGAC